jgi:hypothetical protein
MTAMLLRTIVSSVALAAVLAAPASAAVKLDTPLRPCYVVAQQEQRELIFVNASGFTPFGKVEIVLDDIVQLPADVLRDGTVKGQVRAPWEEEGSRPFTLRVSELGNPANTLTANAMVTRLSVEQSPARASTSQPVRFKGRGFMDFTKPVYAHYVFARKVRKSVRLGLPKGPCGSFNVRRKQFPFKKKSPDRGTWTIQFDQNSYYNANAAVRVPLTIKVRRMLKPQRAQGR